MPAPNAPRVLWASFFVAALLQLPQTSGATDIGRDGVAGAKASRDGRAWPLVRREEKGGTRHQPLSWRIEDVHALVDDASATQLPAQQTPQLANTGVLLEDLHASAAAALKPLQQTPPQLPSPGGPLEDHPAEAKQVRPHIVVAAPPAAASSAAHTNVTLKDALEGPRRRASALSVIAVCGGITMALAASAAVACALRGPGQASMKAARHLTLPSRGGRSLAAQPPWADGKDERSLVHSVGRL